MIAGFRKRTIGRGLVFVLVWLPLVHLGCGSRSGSQRSGNGSTLSAAWVRVERVATKSISHTLRHTGQVEAWRVMNITPEVSGRVAEIYVHEGDRVRKGQILAKLDTRPRELQLEQARAALAVAKANLENARKEFERIEQLYKEGTITQQQYEKVQLALQAAEAQYQQAEANLHLAEYQLEVSIMTAPFDGVITGKWYEVGDVVNPMMGLTGRGSGVLTLADPSKVKVTVDLPSSEVGLVRKGQKAYIEVTYVPGKRFPGQVAWVNPGADPVSKTFSAQVICDNPDWEVRPGTFADVFIVVDERDDALVVPASAVVNDSIVFVVRDSVAVERRVRVGLRNDREAEILSGLEPDELVVIEGNFGLTDGAPIRIVQ
ncbi:MAG: efflux RND transporter periplasmic adaptor subunit [candidate division KSB1 bacterium]|nr:efflux RND transporter periplasmic adaptor subunit [candidate division KSB1 bacterium]